VGGISKIDSLGIEKFNFCFSQLNIFLENYLPRIIIYSTVIFGMRILIMRVFFTIK